MCVCCCSTRFGSISSWPSPRRFSMQDGPSNSKSTRIHQNGCSIWDESEIMSNVTLGEVRQNATIQMLDKALLRKRSIFGVPNIQNVLVFHFWLNNQMSGQPISNTQQNKGELLEGDSKSKDVRMSNILAAKGEPWFVTSSFSSGGRCRADLVGTPWYG